LQELISLVLTCFVPLTRFHIILLIVVSFYSDPLSELIIKFN
jgi:hypothetical protein